MNSRPITTVNPQFRVTSHHSSYSNIGERLADNLNSSKLKTQPADTGPLLSIRPLSTMEPVHPSKKPTAEKAKPPKVSIKAKKPDKIQEGYHARFEFITESRGKYGSDSSLNTWIRRKKKDSVDPLLIFDREFSDGCFVCDNERRDLIREIDREHYRLLHMRQNMRFADQSNKNKRLRTINRQRMQSMRNYDRAGRLHEVDELTVDHITNVK